MKKGVNCVGKVFSLRVARRVAALVLALLMLLPANLVTVLAEAMQGEPTEAVVEVETETEAVEVEAPAAEEDEAAQKAAEEAEAAQKAAEEAEAKKKAEEAEAAQKAAEEAEAKKKAEEAEAAKKAEKEAGEETSPATDDAGEPEEERPDWSDVKVAFTAKDAGGKVLNGYSEKDFAKGSYALDAKAPVSVKGYVYEGATLGDKKIVKVWYSEADLVWYYTEEYIDQENKVQHEDTAIYEKTVFTLRFVKEEIEAPAEEDAADAQEAAPSDSDQVTDAEQPNEEGSVETPAGDEAASSVSVDAEAEEKPVEEPVTEEPVEEPAEEGTTSSVTADATTPSPEGEGSEEPVEEPVEEPAEAPSPDGDDGSAEAQAEEILSADEPTDASAGETTEETSSVSPDGEPASPEGKPYDTPTAEPVTEEPTAPQAPSPDGEGGSAEALTEEVLVEQPVEQPVEEPVEVPVEQPVDEPAKEPAFEAPVEEPIEEIIEEPVEEIVEEPVEAPVPDTVTLTEADITVAALSEGELDGLVGLVNQASQSGATRAPLMAAAEDALGGAVTGYAAFDIRLNNEAYENAGGYVVPVRLDAPIDLLAGRENAEADSASFELYHITDGKAERVEAEFDREGGLLKGFTFACEVAGAQDIALSEILSQLGIAVDEAFMAGIEAVSVSNPEAFRLTEAENDWTFRALRETGAQESITIRMQGGAEHRIEVAVSGVTEVRTDDDSAVIRTVNDMYLPQGEAARAEAVSGDDAIAAVRAQGEVEGAEYRVFDIGLNSADAADYEGFEVDVNLNETLSGWDYKLYQVKDGEATELTDALTLTAEAGEDGRQDVSGFSFTTDDFAQFVLCYTIETYYKAFDGVTFKIALDYSPEAEIPHGAELKVSEILKDCKDENILDLYRDYLVEKPVVEAPSGTYEDSLYLSIEPQAGCIIRYTLDGTVPDESSEVYTEPVTLTTGVYTVWVNATNKFGVSSDVTRCSYKIVPSRPGLPVLKTPSGTYKNPEKIELEIPERGEIRYTTDGTDPTEESELYTEPIPMPDGVSTFKFAVISPEGVSGDIVEAHYNRKAETAVTSADGQNYIIVALIRSGEIVDVNGTIRDGSARFSYWLEGQHQIEGRGSFFIYSEMLTDLTGSSALTGRRFAVNAASGTVYQLEPGANGEQLLLPVG